MPAVVRHNNIVSRQNDMWLRAIGPESLSAVAMIDNPRQRTWLEVSTTVSPQHHANSGRLTPLIGPARFGGLREGN